MRSMAVLLAIMAVMPSALAVPTSNPVAAMIQRFSELPECSTNPGQNCAGAQRVDIILQYSKDQEQRSKNLFLNAAKAAGAEVHEVMDDFG
jgi:hypothetical protein